MNRLTFFLQAGILMVLVLFGSAGHAQTGAYGSPISISVNNSGITSFSSSKNNSTGFTNQLSYNSSPEVWYTFTLPQAADVSISLCGSGIDTYLYLLDNSLDVLYSNDDAGPLCVGSTSSLVEHLSAGTYFIAAEGYGTNTGSIVMDVRTVINGTSPTPVIAYNLPSALQTGALVNFNPVNTGGAVAAGGQVTSTYATGFNNPLNTAIDASGNIYVADAGNHQIQKISPAGVVTVFAGAGYAGYADGTGTAAVFRHPSAIVVDKYSGNLYVSDQQNHRIRKITPAGVVTTFAGSGSAGFADGNGTAASFSTPIGLVFSPSGNLYVADYGNNRIRLITNTGTVITYAGTGTAGAANSTRLSSTFRNPMGLAVDASGNLYVADRINHIVRVINNSTGNVTTLAGSGTAGFAEGTGSSAQFNHANSLSVDASGTVYLADHLNNRIRMITSAGVVTTFAGTGTAATVDGSGAIVSFNSPYGICIDSQGDNLYLAENAANVVRKITIIKGYTISPALPAGLEFNVSTGAITGRPTATSPSTTYTITAYNSSGTGSTTVTFSVTGEGQPDPVVFTPFDKAGYVDEVIVKVSGITVHGHAENLSAAEGIHTRTYVDGLSRPIQKINSGAGTSGKPDLVSFSIYDAYGREKKQYLPFASANTSRAYQSNAETAQAVFYSTSTSTGKYEKDNAPYSVVEYDNSPLNRVIRQGSAGTDWQLSTGKVRQSLQRANVAGDYVRQFNSDASSSGFWAAGTLNVSEATDEEGHKIIVFADKMGKTILKREWVDETIQGSYKDYKNTYYIYDQNSLPVMMLPPKVVDRMMGASWALSSDDLNHNVYRYEYDNTGRQIGKKLPSSGWVYMIYDKLDRLCLMQTAAHRAANKWYFMKYDRLGRTVLEGILVDNIHTSRSSMQIYCDTYDYLNPAVAYFESKGGSIRNYTDVSFPQSTAFASFEPLSVNYFDHYDIDNNGTANYSYAAQSLGADEPVAASAQGQLTVTSSKKLGASDWITKVYFYDGKGQVVQEQSNNTTNLSMNDVHTNVFDFAGLLKRSVNKKTVNSTQHTVDEGMAYDNAARLVSVTHKYNANAVVTLADYVYNELGQLVDKNMGKLGVGSYLQSVDLRYNIRGWLKGINNSDLSNDGYNDESNDVFGMELLYQVSDGGLGNTGLFNGQISAIKWRAKMNSHAYDNVGRAYVYGYDKLGQLRNALFKGNNGSGWSYRNGAFDEKNISYDLNGNILALERSNWTGSVTSMDNLAYSYKSTGGNDKLMQVIDANGGGGTYGFKNQSGDAEHYLYDDDGNLTTDKNKNLTYTYNDLGKVNRVTLLSYTNRYIQYNYDGSGICLSKEVVDNGSTIKTTAYMTGFVAVDNVLSYINTAEGRVRTASGVGTYEYYIKDHLGNVRVSFEDQSGTALVRQENSFYAFGLVHSSSPVISGGNKQITAGAEWDDDFGNDPDLYTMPYRQYDPVLGRFNAVDPMAEKFNDLTIYNFCFNNPVSFSDPSGANPIGTWEDFWNMILDVYLGPHLQYGGYWNAYGGYGGFMDHHDAFDHVNKYLNFTNGWGNATPWGYQTAFNNLVGLVGLPEDRDYWLRGTDINEMKSNPSWLVDRQKELFGDDAYANGYLTNKYGGLTQVGKMNVMDEVQEVLDGVGLVPGIGEFADGANALISLGRGNYFAAGLSAGAMIPFAGWGATGVKMTQKIGIKGGEQLLLKAVKLHKHHVLPQQFRSWFAKRGISNIDHYAVLISQNSHLKGVHGKGIGNLPGQWNKQWSSFIQANPNASPSQIFHHAEGLLQQYGLEHLPYVKYK